MTTQEFLKESFLKLKKRRLLLLAGGIFFLVLAFFYSYNKRTVYTAKATLFPLTSSNTDNAGTTAMLSNILGISGAPNSFSSEAAINIVELANSRSIRESVAATRLPQFGNKTVAELLLNDVNEHKRFYSKKIEIPADSGSLAVIGGDLLLAGIDSKLSKNGVLELYYSSAKKEFITPISNIIIDKLSQFYIDLKRRKALDDYNFTLAKIDSMQRLISGVDKSAINLQKRTMFTPAELLEYSIPKESISTEKNRMLQQREMYINNRDEAAWRLQKNTPVIAVLDKPTEPFDKNEPSLILIPLAGFVFGIFICSAMLLAGLVFRYIKSEIYRSIFE